MSLYSAHTLLTFSHAHELDVGPYINKFQKQPV